jgi:hypothetical protein
MLQIHLIGAPKPPGWQHPHVVFDPAIPPDRCDGMLVWNTVTPEFLSYRGLRAWYISESLGFNSFRTGLFRRARRTLGEHEFLHHSNPNPRYFCPAVTHYGELTPVAAGPRTGNMVATVNDFGNRVWWIRPPFRFRNSFILHPSVDLYGSRESWKRFRRHPWSKPGLPPNYRGSTTATNCWHRDFVAYLSRYRVNVCLENEFMPYWFTEKFVNTALAGCVPVYRAHPTVRDSFLQGARWIDPADFGFDVAATLAAAQECDAAAIRDQNYTWLQSQRLRTTEGYAIWSRIADIFVERSAGNS